MKINNSLLAFNSELIFLYKLFKSNKLAPSNIIVGHDGIGKRTFVNHFSILINLENNEQKNYLKNFSIENSNLIQKIEDNSFERIKILKKNIKEKNIGIESIRKIINFCKYQSFNEKPKIIIINNIEDLSISASNAVLKILESPPENTYFFLLNNSNSKILETIESRCFKIRLKINFSKSKEILDHLMVKQNIETLNYRLISKYDTHGRTLKKMLYYQKNFNENKSVNYIISFCINDFKKNNNLESVEFLLSLVQNHYYKVFLNNDEFFINNKKYNNLLSNIKDCINYNSDFSNLNLFQKIY